MWRAGLGGVYKLLAISVLPAQGFLGRECVGMCVWGNLFPCSYRVYCFREYGSCGLLKYLVDFFFLLLLAPSTCELFDTGVCRGIRAARKTFLPVSF